jgi:hypothetical protein
MGRNSTGAVRARANERRRPAWLWWLLALLALIAVVLLLMALLGGDDEDSGKNATGSSQPVAGARLVSGDQKLLPLPSGGLRPVVGNDTVGNELIVRKVVGGDGFWVGTSAADQIYVEYGGGAGKTEGGFHPDRAGQRVDLDGPVRAAPADPAKTLNLSARDAARVKSEGGYINANRVAPASS